MPSVFLSVLEYIPISVDGRRFIFISSPLISMDPTLLPHHGLEIANAGCMSSLGLELYTT